MRAGRQRPTSQHGPTSLARGSAQAPRKIFNCIVDDTALVAGVKKSTRNGLRQWVNNGQIRLFVPLHGKHHERSLVKNGRKLIDISSGAAEQAEGGAEQTW